MARLSYRNDEQADERLNPTELAQKEHTAGESSSYSGAGIDQAEAYANDPANASQENIKGKEENPTWENKVQGRQDLNQKKLQSSLRFAKKRGGILGLIALFGIGGGLLAGFFGPASMIINLVENFSLANDSASTSMERRFFKLFGNTTGETDPVCANSTKKSMKCRMGRISNSALRKLESRGVKGCFDNKCSGTNNKRLGYPKKNPTHYQIDLGDGSKPKNIAAKDLAGFLAQKENRKIAAKVLGTGGAFNLRYRAWVGKHISGKFYKKFGLKRTGGLADGDNKNLTDEERRKKLEAARTVPETDITGAADSAKERITKQLDRAKKGGGIYLGSVVGCVGIRAPKYIAAAVAAVQLRQLLGIVMDTTLSPGSKAKASGIQNTFTADDMDLLGTTLTEQTAREGDGKKTSALDSPYLLAAMGVNKNKPKVSRDYTPGYSFLMNKGVAFSGMVSGTSDGACDAILSPEAMYTALATQAGLAAATGGIGAIISFAGGWVISTVATQVIDHYFGDKLTAWLLDLAKNGKIATAKGEALGDVLGIGAAGFFSSGGMARHLPTLNQSDLAAYDQIRQENELFHKEMDIASLSPFDTSSRYTFLGSMVHSAQTATIAGGGVKFSSMFANIVRLPSYALAPNAGAATNFTEKYCGYAGDFGFKSGGNSPAINMAGMPCTGITPTQVNMTTEDALKLMCDVEEWVDCDKMEDIPEDATLEELMPDNDSYDGYGIIEEDTPLYDYIDQCSNPDTGDYVFNADSCTTGNGGPGSVRGSGAGGSCFEKPDGTQNCAGEGGNDYSGGSSVEGVKNPLSIPAMAVFLLDYQILQSMNGEDEDDFSDSSSEGGSTTSGGLSWPVSKSFYDKDRTDFLGPHLASSGTFTANGTAVATDISSPPVGTPVYSMLDGKVISTICGGQSLIIESNVEGGTLRIAYAHTSGRKVNIGDTVKSGQEIARLDGLGCRVTGPHLHIDMALNSKLICPQDVFLLMEKGEAVNWSSLTSKAEPHCGGRI